MKSSPRSFFTRFVCARLLQCLPFPTLAAWVFAIITTFMFAANCALAGTFTYSADWLGNSFNAYVSSGTGKHVPNMVSAIAISTSGTLYTDSYYDESSGESTLFNVSGTNAAWMNQMPYLHGWSREGGEAIAISGSYVYLASEQFEYPESGGYSKGDLANNPIYETGTSSKWYLNGNNLSAFPVNNSGEPNYTAIHGNVWFCISRYTLGGSASAIPTYGYGDYKNLIIVSTTEDDAQISGTSNPDGASIGAATDVTGLAANGSYVWASDYANNEIHIYNASTMAPVATWTNISSPGRLTLDGSFNILWVVQGESDNSSSSIVGYDATVTGTATPKGGAITCGTGQQVHAPCALAVDSSHRLLVADNGVFPSSMADGTSPYVLYPDPARAQVSVYHTTGTSNPTYAYTLGSSVFSGTSPGLVGPGGYQNITDIEVDGSGRYYVACTGDPHGIGTGGYIRQFNSDVTGATENWQLFGLQYITCGALDPANLNQFYSSWSGYGMNWSNSPTSGTGNGTAATWNMTTFDPGKFPTDNPTYDLTSDWMTEGVGASGDAPIAFDVRDIGGKPYIFTDNQEMGHILGVMRLDGNLATPACVFGKNEIGWPSDVSLDNFYYWNDTNGDGCMASSEFTSGTTAAYDPLSLLTAYGKWVDDNANIWVSNGLVLREVQITGTNSHGVPQYNISSPVTWSVSGTGSVITDTDWKKVEHLAYLPTSDTMILAGNTTALSSSGSEESFAVIRSYPNWSTATPTNRIGHAWSVNGSNDGGGGLGWRGLYAFGSYVFACQSVEYVNAINVYALTTGTLAGTMTPPAGFAATGNVDIDNPMTARTLSDGSYVVFQENDFMNDVLIYRFLP